MYDKDLIPYPKDKVLRVIEENKEIRLADSVDKSGLVEGTVLVAVRDLEREGFIKQVNRSAEIAWNNSDATYVPIE